MTAAKSGYIYKQFNGSEKSPIKNANVRNKSCPVVLH